MSDWIKCSDEMPDEETVVIIQGGLALVRDGVWRTCMEMTHPLIQWEVGHWMPYPSPPESSDE